jgi:N utilization substance protein B
MKTIKDPRHKVRRQIVAELFSESFTKDQKKLSVSSQEILSKKEELDHEIAKAAPTWPIEKLNKIDLVILRLAVYELMYKNSIPSKVAIDEAIELAKEFGAENSAGFVNGVLGTVYKNIQKEK